MSRGILNYKQFYSWAPGPPPRPPQETFGINDKKTSPTIVPWNEVSLTIHRLNLERLNLERPNLERLNPEWTEPRMD